LEHRTLPVEKLQQEPTLGDAASKSIRLVADEKNIGCSLSLGTTYFIAAEK
jgi:hypothetical protein